MCLTTCAGNKLAFMVTDPSKFTVQGDGLGLVRINQTASFTVCAPCAQVEDIGVTITGRFYVYTLWFSSINVCVTCDL